jgi:hypothetical protein
VTENAERRRKRLSADLPQHWLREPPYWSLSNRAWRLHTHALMWAIGRTNGMIPEHMITTLLRCSDAQRLDAAAELVDAGLWKHTTDGWRVVDWNDSQSTVEQIDHNREQLRERVARHRQVKREADQ